jgi:hypothetical protein
MPGRGPETGPPNSGDRTRREKLFVEKAKSAGKPASGDGDRGFLSARNLMNIFIKYI